MANPLFKQLGGNQSANDSGFMAFVEQFNQFRANFQGDPKVEIQKLLQSGKITQQQLDKVQQMAAQFQRLLPH
ncbi:MAG: hypothetical protein IJ428_02860 [Clostridia bacterium]|nr:hypothetical protein [Clostridia bacterium]